MFGAKRKYVAYLLLLLYIGYYGAVSYFIHIHVYNNVVYTHSHPYQKAKGKLPDKQLPFEANHTHNNAGFSTFNQLSNLTSVEGNSYIFENPILNSQTFEYKEYNQRNVLFVLNSLTRLRAPPFFS